MKHIILVLSFFALGGCYASTGLNVANLAQQQDIIEPRTGSASYEMYSWYNGQDWVYALFETATGISTFADITASPDTLVGTDNAAESLKTLPRGTKVYWNLKRIKGFTLPTQNFIDKLALTAKKAGVELEVIAWP